MQLMQPTKHDTRNQLLNDKSHALDVSQPGYNGDMFYLEYVFHIEYNLWCAAKFYKDLHFLQMLLYYLRS